ncbi:MAG TPA: aldo/keto reductase [Sedimentisphaerales bacterium]|jgi:aryl-alcohol dehydrogenase-like predicted oxidoreductase|nr:aldo/keto reductase [Sedimentisphaerales bacterium]HNU30797.1 aldo/keto reductase [Sedimentisphaerales bacterium]
MQRREFLKSGAVVAGSVATGGLVQGAEPECDCVSAPKLPRRAYGDTSERLSIIGFGGLVVSGAEQEKANRLVAEAVEKGVNYFDVAPTYGDAEVKLGPALEPYRKDVFLACKTTQRTKEGVASELAESLQRLRTDHLDLYQLHAISDVPKDVDAAFAPGGAMKVFLEVKKQGQVRYLGFSAHSEEAALAAMERYDFDSILFPVNFAMYYKGDFGPRVIEAAKAKGVARLALKAMAKQKWPEGDPLRPQYPECWYQPLTDRSEAKLGLYFTLSQSVTAAIPPGDESLFRLALELAMGFRPVSQKEKDSLRQMAQSLNPVFASGGGV